MAAPGCGPRGCAVRVRPGAGAGAPAAVAGRPGAAARALNTAVRLRGAGYGERAAAARRGAADRLSGRRGPSLRHRPARGRPTGCQAPGPFLWHPGGSRAVGAAGPVIASQGGGSRTAVAHRVRRSGRRDAGDGAPGAGSVPLRRRAWPPAARTARRPGASVLVRRVRKGAVPRLPAAVRPRAGCVRGPRGGRVRTPGVPGRGVSPRPPTRRRSAGRCRRGRWRPTVPRYGPGRRSGW